MLPPIDGIDDGNVPRHGVHALWSKSSGADLRLYLLLISSLFVLIWVWDSRASWVSSGKGYPYRAPLVQLGCWRGQAQSSASYYCRRPWLSVCALKRRLIYMSLSWVLARAIPTRERAILARSFFMGLCASSAVWRGGGREGQAKESRSLHVNCARRGGGTEGGRQRGLLNVGRACRGRCLDDYLTKHRKVRPFPVSFGEFPLKCILNYACYYSKIFA